jgi:PAS domain S-box-containing protein
MGLDQITAAAFLSAFPEPALAMDAGGTIVFSNAAARRLLAAPDGVDGMSVTRFLPEEERTRLNPLHWLRRWAEVPDAPEQRHVYLLCRSLAGEETPVRVRVARVSGTPPLYVVLLHDIGEEQARLHRLREAHRLAARLLALSADGIINVDEQLRITYANASAERLFGYPPGAMTGLPLDVLLPERFRASHRNYIERFIREPAASHLMGERGRITGLSRAGEELPLEATITKVTLDQALILSAQLRDLRPRDTARASAPAA